MSLLPDFNIWTEKVPLTAEEEAFAAKLAARWSALVAWASGCLSSDYDGAAGAVRGAICDAQGVANLRTKLKSCGAGGWIDHWFKDANPRRVKGGGALEATELDVLGSELAQVEKCAEKEGYRAPAGDRMKPPERQDAPAPFLASWAAALDRMVNAPPSPPPPPASPWKAVGAAVALGLVGAAAYLAGKGR